MRTATLLRSGLDLALPRSCAACGAGGDAVCDGCLRESAAALFAGGPHVVRPDPSPPGLGPVWAGGAYAGALGALIAAYKDGDRRDLRALLSRLFVVVLAAALGGAGAEAVVVAVPSSAHSRRVRGDAPVGDLIRTTARACGAPCADLLRTRGRPADQARLTAAKRAANLRGRMAVAPGYRSLARAGVPVVLADDVLTTGATLTEASRAIRSAGGRVVAAAVLAATPRRA